MARSTVSTIIDRIQRQMASSLRMEVNVLGALLANDATATTVTMQYDLAPSLRSGAIISVGNELMRVITVNANAREVTVIRAWQDSSTEAHASGAEVGINPRFTRFDIFDAIVDELDSWAPDLFYVSDHEFTVAEDAQTVELPTSMADAIGVVSVRGQAADRAVDTTTWPQLEFRLQRGDPAVWSQATESGLAIRLLRGVASSGRMPAGSVLVSVARPFSTTGLVATTDLVTTTKLAPSMLDVLHLGVKARLMGDDEYGRTGRTTQDEPRRTEETPPGSSWQISGGTLQRYERRFAREVQRLRLLYSVVSW
jgi:hypothetical protein